MKFKFLHLGFVLLLMSHTSISLGQGTGGIPLFQIPPAPIQSHQPPKIEIEKPLQQVLPDVADVTTIRVNNINITGQYLYKESELILISGFTPGMDLSLTELRAMTTRITNHYRKNGFFLALAYLPTQDIKNGIVTIAVVIGQYGAVSINNKTNLSNTLANNLISGLDMGDPIESGPLETRLLLLSDLPGVNVNSTLAPGSSPGTSDLSIDLTPGARVTGSIDADNAGLQFTGNYRLGGTINVNNLAGMGDTASLRALSSGNGMTYGRASYQFQVERLTLGTAYTQIDYSLGNEFTDLGVHGVAKIASIFANYPLVRTRDSNLYATLGYDMRTYQDKVDLTDLRTDKRANVFMPGIYGDFRDKLGEGGLTGYGLTLSLGDLDIDSDTAREFDEATSQTNGRYNKLAFNAMRLQRITESFSLYGAINGQIASKNLDIWEKMELGGMYGVRAYPAGTAFGDQGYLLTIEARFLLPKLSDSIVGRIQLIGLFDTGSIQYNKNKWSSEDNAVSLSGAGVGVMWSDPNNFSVKGYYAHKVGSSPDTLQSSASGQFWVQLVKYF